VLFDLKWLEPGQKFPPSSEDARLKRYTGNRQLYETDHDEVFGQWFRTIRHDTDASLEILFDFPRRLSNLWASLLVGDSPTFAPSGGEGEDRTEVKKRLGTLVQKSGLNAALRECVVDMSRFGDGLLKTRKDEGGVVVEAVSPELWFPVVERGNVRKIKQHVLAWTFEEDRSDGVFSQIAGAFAGTSKKYLYAEIHSPGSVEYRLHDVGHDGRISSQVSDQKARELFGEWVPSETHAAKGMLVVHVPNRRTSNRLHGYDDYKSIEGDVMEIEVRLAQWSRINDRHADPPMVGPRITPPTDADELARVASGEKYITVEATGAGDDVTLPQYVTWDQNVESIKGEIEELKEHLFIASETSPTAFGVSRTGYAESGTSLALRMQSEQEKSGDMRTFLDAGAKEVILLATSLDGAPIEDADIGWKDGLPQDKKEQTEIEVQRLERRLTSRKRAIMRLYDMDEEEAEEEMKRIDEELESASVAPGLANGSLERSRQLLEGALSGQEANGTPPEDPAA
jgi:hypothetical protein